MESILTFICEHASEAHWIIFLLLLLAGLNVPISEDFLLLTGGAIASTCLPPDRKWHLFVWLYFGCLFSAWEAYWIGRLLGPKLYKIRWFSHVLTPKRIERLHHYYEKFGIFTFIIGRFIPGGVRNALFMTSGLGKMPFLRFISRDGFACLLSTSCLFYLGYVFGENHAALIHYFKAYNEIFLSILAIGIVIIGGIIIYRRQIKMT